MDKETYNALAKARIDRAAELVEEAQDLLANDRYKSANNRAFYAMEKTMKALLALKEISADSHNGCLKQFNVHFIKDEVGGFSAGDYKRVANAQRIRNNSDYDDFYIADKKECQDQVEMAKEFLEKAKKYMSENNN